MIALTEAPILTSPNYSKGFLTFSFSSKDTSVVLLLQNNDEGYENPNSFLTRY